MVPKHATSLESRTILLMFFCMLLLTTSGFEERTYSWCRCTQKTAESLGFEDDNARSKSSAQY
jgi:hypothetical protein